MLLFGAYPGKLLVIVPDIVLGILMVMGLPKLTVKLLAALPLKSVITVSEVKVLHTFPPAVVILFMLLFTKEETFETSLAIEL